VVNRSTLRGALIAVRSLRDVSQSHVRIRDPERKNRILVAAVDLFARKGFHDVSMAEIGAAAGIRGSGVYWHFDSKSAVLVALFDRAIDDRLADARNILATTSALARAVDLLIAGQVDFVVGDRELAQAPTLLDEEFCA
jgi:AcrR family transcriptional regulator